MAAIAAPPQLTFTNSSGLPFAGYKLFTYVTNTTTKKTTFSTAAGMETNTNPNSNPIILDANGSAPVWFPGTIKYVLAPPDDSDPPLSAIATWDSVPSVSTIQIDQFFETPSADVISLKSGIDLGIYSGQFIVDENQNPYIQFVKVANAINYVKITNAAIGNPPRIESAGGDTDVTLLIAPKNAGSINMAATSGDITAISNSGTVELRGSEVVLNQPDTRTNSVAKFIMSATTSGTPSSGIGTAIQLNATSADETSAAFGALTFQATDVSSGSEDTKFVIQTRTGGADLADTWELLNGANKATFQKTLTAPRVYTFPDRDTTIAADATRAEQESAVSTAVYTSPGTQKFHPTAIKAQVLVNGAGTLIYADNISSVSRTGTGQYLITYNTNMSSANYSAVAQNHGGAGAHITLTTLTASTATAVIRTTVTDTDIDESFSIHVSGTLA